MVLGASRRTSSTATATATRTRAPLVRRKPTVANPFSPSKACCTPSQQQQPQPQQQLAPLQRFISKHVLQITNLLRGARSSNSTEHTQALRETTSFCEDPHRVRPR